MEDIRCYIGKEIHQELDIIEKTTGNLSLTIIKKDGCPTVLYKLNYLKFSHDSQIMKP